MHINAAEQRDFMDFSLLNLIAVPGPGAIHGC
jgi:hypothetical protein